LTHTVQLPPPLLSPVWQTMQVNRSGMSEQTDIRTVTCEQHVP